MKRCFIAGTGTDVGKTLVACALAQQWRAAGKRVTALKPVISGFDMGELEASDTGRLMEAQGMHIDPASIDRISPWRFATPLSVDMAARRESKPFDFDTLIGFCRKEREGDALIIEGAGGVMSPLDGTRTMLDWMGALGFPVLLVAGSYLGTLSHTFSAVKAITGAGLNLAGIVLSESVGSPASLGETAESLRAHLGATCEVLPVARLDSSTKMWKDVPDITHLIP